MNKSRIIIMLVLVLLELFGLILFYNPLSQWFYQFFLSEISPDGYLETGKSLTDFVLIYGLLVFDLLVFSIINIRELLLLIKEGFHERSVWLSWLVLFPIGIVWFYLNREYSSYHLDFLFGKEGLSEYASFMIYLITGIVFIAISLRSRKQKAKTNTARSAVLKWFWLVLGVLLFLASMEEISWGQTFFKWETPEALSEMNYQEETNLHNILNPVYIYLYPVFGLIFLGSFLVGSIFFVNHPDHSLRILMPNLGLLPLILLIFLASIPDWDELVEEYAAMFLALYCIQQVGSFRKIHAPKPVTD